MAPPRCPRCGEGTSEVTGFCDACGWPRPRSPGSENAPIVAGYAPSAASLSAPVAAPAQWTPPVVAPPQYPAQYPAPYAAPVPAGAAAPYGYPLPPPPYGYPPPPPPHGYPPPYYPGAPLPYGYPPPGYPGLAYPPAGYQPQQLVPAAQLLAKRSARARWVAAIVDCTIVIALWFSLSTLLRDSLLAGSPGGFLPVTLFLGFGYYIIPDALGKGTVGKVVAGVRVFDINLKPARAARIVARSLELIPWVIFFGLLFAFFQSYYIDKIGQGLGDYISKTYVIKTKEVAALAPPPA